VTFVEVAKIAETLQRRRMVLITVRKDNLSAAARERLLSGVLGSALWSTCALGRH